MSKTIKLKIRKPRTKEVLTAATVATLLAIAGPANLAQDPTPKTDGQNSPVNHPTHEGPPAAVVVVICGDA